MSDVKFLLEFAQSGNLTKTIKDIEQLNNLLSKNIDLQKGFSSAASDGAKKAANEYTNLQGKVKDLAMSFQNSNDAKKIESLTVELQQLQKQYDKLRVSTKSINDELIKEEKLRQQQIKTSEMLRKQKENLRKDDEKKKKQEEQQNSLYAIESKRLNDLRKQYKELALAKGLTAKETKALLPEIIKLDAKLKSIDASVGQFQRNVGNYTGAIKSAGIGALRFGAALGGVTLAGSAVTAFIKNSVADFKEFDKSLKEVSAITGLAGDELNFFKEAALESGKNTRVGAKDYLEAVKLIGSASPVLLKNKDALKAVTDEAIILSEAAGIDLPTAASALTASLNQFGLKADQSRRIINALAAGSKEGSAEVSELTESFKNVGTVASDANMSVEDTVSLLETLAEKQLKGAEAGTKLRGVISKLQQEGVGFKSGKFNITDALNETKTLLEKIKDPAEKAQKEIKLFGLENRVAGSILVNNIDKFNELSKAVTGTNTALEQSATNNESAAAKSERLENKLKTLRIELGEKLLPVLIKITEIGISVVEFFNDLLGSIDSTINKIKNEFNELEKTAQRNKQAFIDLNSAFKNGKISIDEFKNAMLGLNSAYKLLDESTSETQKEGDILLKQFQSGKITVNEFALKVKALIELEKIRRKNLKQNNEDLLSENKELVLSDGDVEDGIKKIQDAREKAFNAALQKLEKEKRLAEIKAVKEISDEKELIKEKEAINRDYLDLKIKLEEKYNKDYTNSLLEQVNIDRKIREEIINNIKEQYKILDEIELNRMKDGEDKAIISEMRRLEGRLEQLKKDGRLSQEVEEELTRETEEKINDIRKEYRLKRHEEEISDLDTLYTERETILIQTISNEDKLDEFMHQERINRLEDELKLRRKYLEENTKLSDEEKKKENEKIIQLENQLAKEKKSIRDKEKEIEKQRIQDTLEFTKATTDKVLELLNRRITEYQKEVDMQEKNIEAQRKLAESGMENTLAFEKQMSAEKQKQLLEQQRKAEKIKKLEAYFDLLAAYASKDPTNAPVKALAQIKVAEAIVAKLESGGVLEDVTDKGIFKGASHKNGGIKIPVMEFEGDEGIFSKNEMSNLGKDNFYKLKEGLKNNNFEDIVKQKNNFKSIINEQRFNVELNLKPLQHQMKEIKEAIENKPIPKFVIDRNGNLITEEIAKGLIKRTIQKNKGFNG